MSNYLNDRSGWKSWLFTHDHKRIGVLYLAAALSVFLFGGIFAVLLRSELLTPDASFMDADVFDRIFTLHGVVMVFLFLIPAIPATLGNFLLPLMLGARRLAFPRLNLISFWLYILGALFGVFSMIAYSVDGGWTLYAPLMTDRTWSIIQAVIGLSILGLSAILTALNFIVSIHRMRPAGMSWFKMPIFAWTLYFSSIVQVIATPMLGVSLLLLITGRASGAGLLDPGLFERLFWLYGHPAVYISLLPAMGIVGEVIPVFSRKPLFGYKSAVYSSAALAFFTLFSWGEHLYTSDQSGMASMVFSLMALSAFVPAATIIFDWVLTLYGGAVRLAAPMHYALMSVFLISIGELSGLFLGNMTTGQHLQGTLFESAHFHFLFAGGVLTAFLAGLHYWWPKIFGKMFSEAWAKLAAWLLFAGAAISFIPQMLMGARGLPQRIFAYPPEFAHGQRLSGLGGYLMALGLVIAAITLLRSLTGKEDAPGNPWGAASMEWLHLPSPPSAGDVPEHPGQLGES